MEEVKADLGYWHEAFHDVISQRVEILFKDHVNVLTENLGDFCPTVKDKINYLNEQRRFYLNFEGRYLKFGKTIATTHIMGCLKPKYFQRTLSKEGFTYKELASDSDTKFILDYHIDYYKHKAVIDFILTLSKKYASIEDLKQIDELFARLGEAEKVNETITNELQLAQTKINSKSASNATEVKYLDKNGNKFTIPTVARYYAIANIKVSDNKKANDIVGLYGHKSGKHFKSTIRKFSELSIRLSPNSKGKKSENVTVDSYNSVIELCEILNDDKTKKIATTELAEYRKKYPY